MSDYKFRWDHYTALRKWIVYKRVKPAGWFSKSVWEQIGEFSEADPKLGQKRAEELIKSYAVHKVPSEYYDRYGERIVEGW